MGKNVAVLGSGSWGTALAHHLKQAGYNVTISGREPEVLREISTQSTNKKYFPNETIAEGILTAESSKDAVKDASFIVVSVPSSGMRSVAQEIRNSVKQGALVVSTAKGLEDVTLLRMTQVLEEELGTKAAVAALTGPSFALEVLRGLPTAVTAASTDKSAAERTAKLFHHGNFRIYSSSDVIGAELGGVFKNVIAIAAGVVDATNMGTNARAALITRGLAEMQRLVVKSGGKAETVSGLSGLGDLLLTATGDLSRNRRVGLALGQGKSLEQAVSELGQVAEGVISTKKIIALAERLEVTLPITVEVNRLLEGESTVKESVSALLSRERVSED